MRRVEFGTSSCGLIFRIFLLISNHIIIESNSWFLRYILILQFQVELNLIHAYNVFCLYNSNQDEIFSNAKNVFKDMKINNYRIRINKPPAVYKKIKVLSWWFIEIFPKFDQKSPKKWTFWVKKWWFIWILYNWQFNQEWRFDGADTVISSLILSANSKKIFTK